MSRIFETVPMTAADKVTYSNNVNLLDGSTVDASHCYGGTADHTAVKP